MKNLTNKPAWQALCRHFNEISAAHMRDAFAKDQLRFDKFSLKNGEILLDYSRNRIDDHTLRLLIELAEDSNIKEKICDLFAGKNINTSEHRPALHVALRAGDKEPLIVNNTDVTKLVTEERERIFQFANDVICGKRVSASGKPFKHVINIGIGGSHLGPKMCTEALKDFAISDLSFHFISTIDPDLLRDVLSQIDPETSLFIISSKSFSTIETLTNARAVLTWLSDQLGSESVKKNTIAVTACRDKAVDFGISENAIFSLWDWVGGRYSIWSAIGLPLVLLIGPERFSEFLEGAHDIDNHFRTAPLSQNIPVILALLAIWYGNFFEASAHAIAPYSHRLRSLVSYIQQLEMESSGKSTTYDGERTDYSTGTVIFGEEGCNGQHSYNQLLHQGQHFIPVDFILIAKSHHHASQHQHEMLLASALSQAFALMHGTSLTDTKLNEKHFEEHRIIAGNKPCNIIMLEQLTPRNLGSLLAIYEHKIFVQCAIWNINPFDQWGVELGKQTLPIILHEIQNASGNDTIDFATAKLIDHFNKQKGKI
ncbi:MAG TPA: glucose-6-phosphate isomerase [Gammaproteobacteria bacterium]|jgi:glucose-6-phosphate isomerase|nr:glucose-6-phosphate isomerase [Gammaproteobacteria bacterium]